MGESAAREVLLTFKVAVDEASRASAAKSLGDLTKQQLTNAKNVEKEQLRAQKNVDREADRAAKEQTRRDATIFRERMKIIRDREKEEARAAKEAERRATAELRDEQRRSNEILKTRQRLWKDSERASAQEARAAERSASARARAEQTAAGQMKAANAQAVEGFRMLAGGVGQAVRALGYLAASDEETAEAMAKTVLAVEGTVAALTTLTNVGQGAIKMWQAYQAAQAAGNLSGGMKLLGMAGRALPVVGGIAAAAGGVMASGIPQRAMDAWNGTSGQVGSYNDRQAQSFLNDMNTPRSQRTWKQSAQLAVGNFLDSGPAWDSEAGWTMGSTRRRQRQEAADMVRQAQADESAATYRSQLYNQALTTRGAQDWGAATLASARREQRYAREDLQWEMGPKDLASATKRRTGAESEVTAARAELEKAKASRQPGGRLEDVASPEKLAAAEQRYAQAIDRSRDARRQEIEIFRQGTREKLDGIRQTIQGLEQELETHKRLAQEAEQGKRSTLERLGSMSAVERQQAIEAKKAVDAGTATVEQERIVSGLVQSGGKTDTKLRDKWRQRAIDEGAGVYSEDFDEKKATEDKAAREISARIKDERKVVVKIERDDKNLVEQMAKEAAKAIAERDQLLWPAIEKAIQAEVSSRMQQGRPNLNPVLRGNT